MEPTKNEAKGISITALSQIEAGVAQILGLPNTPEYKRLKDIAAAIVPLKEELYRLATLEDRNGLQRERLLKMGKQLFNGWIPERLNAFYFWDYIEARYGSFSDFARGFDFDANDVRPIPPSRWSREEWYRIYNALKPTRREDLAFLNRRAAGDPDTLPTLPSSINSDQ